VGDGDLCVLRQITIPNPDSAAAWMLGTRRLHRLDGAGVDPVIGWILYLWYGRGKKMWIKQMGTFLFS
jgi:hypothetical protein